MRNDKYSVILSAEKDLFRALLSAVAWRGFSVMSYDRLRAVLSAPRVFSRAPSTTVEGGVRGGQGEF